jgi:hypothetical protein
MGFLKRFLGRTPALVPADDVVTLRSLLLTERDPITRHVIFCELERCLYESRHEFTSALDEFDDVCLEHDSEMDTIRVALLERYTHLPEIELYTRAVTRCQAARDWRGVARWSERAIEVYGDDAIPEAVEKLVRLARPRV